MHARGVFEMTYRSTDVSGAPKRFYGHPEAFEEQEGGQRGKGIG